MIDGEDERWIQMAEVYAETYADCTRRQVGCIIVNGGSFLSWGANHGAGGKSCTAGDCPRGLLSLAECPPYTAYGNCISVHAEISAIRKAREWFEYRNLESGALAGGCVLYVTEHPCAECQRAIKEANIRRVVVSPRALEVP